MNEPLIDKSWNGYQRRIQRDILELQRRMGVLPDRLAPVGVLVSDADAASETGAYSTGPTTTNRPPHTVTTWSLDVVKYSDTAGVQTAYGYNAAAGVVYRRTRIGGTWQPWGLLSTPTLSIAPTFGANVTLGNGTASVKYSVSDGLCIAALRFVFGSTTNVTGDFTLSQPVPMVPGANNILGANCRAIVGSNIAQLQTIVAGGNLYVRRLNIQNTTIITGYGNFLEANAFAATLAAGSTIEATWVYPTL